MFVLNMSILHRDESFIIKWGGIGSGKDFSFFFVFFFFVFVLPYMGVAALLVM